MRVRPILIFCLIGSTSVSSSTAGAAATHQVVDHPMAGAWVADMAVSKPSPAYPLRAVTIRLSVGERSVTVTNEIVDVSGKEHRASETLSTTGEQTAGTLSAGIVHTARWLDRDVLVTLARRGGAVVLITTYELSVDGRQLTVRTSGALDQMVVLRRQAE
jgi:hypothetical protein